MEIVKSGDQNLIIKVSGEINLETHSQIKNKVLDNLTDELKKVFWDLGEVKYIDSSGLGLLIYFDKFLRSSGKSMALKAVPENILRVIKLSGLDKFLSFVE
jgi:anti-anti-sigma factor